MGEKETGAVAAGAPSALASGGAVAAGRESSAPSVSERTTANDDWTAPAGAAQKSVKSGKSNSSEFTDALAGDDGPPPSSAPSVSERTTANDDWTAPAGVAPGGGSTPVPADGAVVKSKSNITNNRESAPGDGGQPGIAIGDPGVNGNIAPSEDEGGSTPTPVEASNLNLSKSNINRNAQPGDGGTPPSSETAIIKSKSNITNN